jgi:hypothetical protein
MVKKLLVSFTAAATAACMVLTPSITVFADDAPTTPVTGNNTINGNVTSTDGMGAVNAYDNATITVNGDVTSSGTSSSSGEVASQAVFANDATVNITGNVTASDGAPAVTAQNSATVTIGGNVNQSGVTPGSDSYGPKETAGNGVTVSNGSTVTVDGDVTDKDGGIGVSVFTNSTSASNPSASNVTIKGNVDASGTTKYTDSNGKTAYDGSTGVKVNGENTVTVGGNVVGGETGVSAKNESTITVGGSVTATGVDHTTYIWNPETNAYDIPSTSVEGKGLVTDGDANITIGGNVNGVNLGILINPDNDNKAKQVVIAGTINTSSRNADGIQISRSTQAQGGYNYSNVEDFMNDVPVIVVGGINAAYPVYANAEINGVKDSTTKAALTEAVVNTINYIINVENQTKNNYGVKVSGDNVHQIAGFDTVNINKSFNVSASIPSDYYLSGGDYVNVVDNGNGTYTLTLTNAKGGIYVKAILKKVDDAFVVSTDDGTYINNPPSNEPPAGAISVSTAAAGTTSAISGDKPAVSLSFDLGKVTPVQYRAAVIENIEKAPKGGAFNIETDRVSFFDRNMIEAFAKHNDIDINVVFTYNGKKIKVTIPAGYDVTKLLDDNGYCGYLRLLSLLGGTDLAQ